MEDLIKALQIFAKYEPTTKFNRKYPTRCEHDVLYVCGIRANDVSDEDKAELKKLSFTNDMHYPDTFSSFRFGSR